MKVKFEKFTPLSLIVLGLYIFLPFERLFTLELFGLTLKISFALLLILIAIYLSKFRTHQLYLEDKILLWFVALSYLTSIWSIDQLRSVIISSIFAATLIGFVALRRNIDEKLAVKIKTILIIAGGLLSLFALWQYFADLNGLSSFLRASYTKVVFGFPRPQATFLEPLYFANFLLIPIYFSIEELLISNLGKKFWFCAADLLLMISVLVLTLSRGAYIAFGFSFVVFAVLVAYKFKDRLKKLGQIAIIIALGLIAGTSIIYFTASKESFGMFVDHAGVADAGTGESTLSRVEFSKIALQESIKNPFGIGAGAFGALPEFNHIKARGEYQTVTNLYLEVLVEEGFLGLFLFLGFVILLLLFHFRKLLAGNLDNLIFFSLIIAILVQALTFSALYILPIWALFALSWRRAN